jgi:hypothetical protein
VNAERVVRRLRTPVRAVRRGWGAVHGAMRPRLSVATTRPVVAGTAAALLWFALAWYIALELAASRALGVAAAADAPAPDAADGAELHAAADTAWQGALWIAAADLAGAALFGVYRAPRAAAPAVPAPVEVPESVLTLRLRGVFTHSEVAQAAALIAPDERAPALRVALGESPAPETELVAVALDHVLIRHRGELQKLSLYPPSEQTDRKRGQIYFHAMPSTA